MSPILMSWPFGVTTVLSSQLRLTSAPFLGLTVIVLAVASTAVTSPLTECALAAVCFLVLFLVDLVEDIEPFDMSPLMLPPVLPLPMLPVPLSVPMAPVEPVCAPAMAAVATPIRPHRTHTE